MPKKSTVNVFNENLTNADSGFRTLYPKIITSCSTKRYRYATLADDVSDGIYMYKTNKHTNDISN